METSDQSEFTKPPEAVVLSQEQIVHHNLRVFKRLADFCNKLPFAGKLAITPITSDAIRKRNPYYKTVKPSKRPGCLE